MSVLQEIKYVKYIGKELETLSLAELNEKIQLIGKELTSKPVTYKQSATLFFLGKLLGVVLFAISLPIIIISCLIVFFEDNSSPLFVQKRYGLNSKIINVFKVRTLYKSQGDTSGKNQVTSNDIRVLKSGRILRDTHIDELPQFFNLIVGNLSIVGPRVQVPGQIAGKTTYENFSEYYLYRHLVAPGLTGLAQCLGCSGPTVIERDASARLYLDLLYVTRKSKSLDLAIILMTIRMMLKKTFSKKLYE